jgi:hypothetical protein
VPIRCALATISSLFMPTSGRRIGMRVASLIVARFTSVCEDTCPTASPVTIACARVCLATASAARSIRRFRITCQ